MKRKIRLTAMFMAATLFFHTLTASATADGTIAPFWALSATAQASESGIGGASTGDASGDSSVSAGDVSNGDPAVSAGDVSNGDPAVSAGDVSNGAPAVSAGDVSNGDPSLSTGDVSNGAPAVSAGDVSNGAPAVSAGDVSSGSPAVSAGDIVPPIHVSAVEKDLLWYRSVTGDSEKGVNDIIKITSGEELILLSYVTPTAYRGMKLYFVASNSDGFDTTQPVIPEGEEEEYVFQGLGGDSASESFKGIIELAEGSGGLILILNRSLFRMISDETVLLSGLNLQYQETPGALFAETVVHGAVDTANTWTFRLTKNSEESLVAAPVLGIMDTDAMVNLSVNNSITAGVSIVGDAGFLCGSMESRAALALTQWQGVIPAVTSTAGNAGGLVGSMAAGSKLTVDDAVQLSISNVTAAENAGGLIGLADDAVWSIGNNETSTATIQGKTAGGLIGKYNIASDGAAITIEHSISGITLIGSENAGGLFGFLSNNTTRTITMTPEGAVNVSFGSTATGNAGGLIGCYRALGLKTALIINSGAITSVCLGSTAKSYGGLVGKAEGSATYFEIGVPELGGDNTETYLTVATDGVVTDFYGGLIGNLYESKGHMVKVRNVCIRNSTSSKGPKGGAGLVGGMDGGALWLAGSVDVSNFTPQRDNLNLRGFILGRRGDVLVYNTYKVDAWEFNKGNDSGGRGANDIGSWGQVIQMVDGLNGLITFSEVEHTVTVSPATKSDGVFVVGNIKEFAAVALRMQLSSLGALIVQDSFAKDTQVTISVTNPISLGSTGFTGFQRDINCNSLDITIKSADETKKRILLPDDIVIYNTGSSHNRLGLFSTVRNLTVENIEIAGVERINSLGDSIYAAGLVANTSGTVVLKKVTGTVNIDATGSLTNSRLAGLIAYSTGSSILFEDCVWNSSLQDHSANTCALGGFLARSDRSVAITVKNCSIGGSITKSSNNNSGNNEGYAAVGGLIASIIDRDSGSSTYNNSLTIDRLDVDGVAVVLESSKTGDNTCGGLLGYEWMGTEAVIKGVTIQNSHLDAADAQFGGLVYKGSGYWQVVKENDRKGISLGTGNTFSGATQNTSPSGLLVGRGDKIEYHRNALYLEIGDDAYGIDSSTTISLTGGTYFDEIMGTGISPDGLGNGIVSVATPGNGLIDPKAGDCNTYVQQITNGGSKWNNAQTRYYYNLDSFRGENGANIPAGTIDSASDMVLWSASQHCYSGLKAYFTAANSFTVTGDIDLTGYSYYPVVYSNYTLINSANITFDFESIEQKEANNKLPSDELCQHAGMHTGIFSDVIVRYSNQTLRVQSLRLQGTVGGLDGNFGAIICGVAESVNPNYFLTLQLSEIELDGIRVSPIVSSTSTIAPLLVNRIGSYTTLTVSDVTTVANTDYQSLADGDYIASSLIGRVGGPQGSNMQLTFSNMGLDGRTTKGATLVHNTYRTLFGRALFLEEFCYSEASTCRGTYNFKNDGSIYTMGQELSNTENGTVSGRNNGQQYCFLGTTDKVCATLGSDDPAGCFVSYRRYVAQREGGTLNEIIDAVNVSRTNHELDINITKSGLLEGCGTYSHPYVITSAGQLQALAQTLTSDGLNDGWIINLDPNILGSTFRNQNGHTDHTSENSCCRKYIGTSTGWKLEDGDADDASATKANVAAYLRNAYYLIDGTIQMEGTWAGLGGNTKETAFSGVLIGKNNAVVEIGSIDSESQFGGLIKFSQGSVVKDLRVSYTAAPSIAASTEICTDTTGNSKYAFFGGVVGWCFGGDTILDNVEVSFAENPVLTGTTNLNLAAMGGYAGVVGGYYESDASKQGGGVVFRNITSSDGKLLAVTISDNSTVVDATAEALDSKTGKSYFYINPYVGRVLDGYAMSEGTNQLENTDKNYRIPAITNKKHLTRVDDTVTVSDAEGLWLLSAIANSGAGSLNKTINWGYYYGKPRTASYSKIGKSILSEDTELSDEAWLGGNSSQKTTAYLIENYTEGDFSTICTNAISIVIGADCDMTSYGNGFRGIGTSFGTNLSRNDKNDKRIKLLSLNGNQHTITLNQSRRENTEEHEAWRSMGAGLFVELCVPANGSVTISDLKLAGNVGITYFTGAVLADKTSLDATTVLNTGNRHGCVGAGMLASGFSRAGKIDTITLDNVQVIGTEEKKATVNGTGDAVSFFAGGLIGLVWTPGNSIENVVLRDCKYTHLAVTGRANVGGLLGYVKATGVSVEYTQDTELLDGAFASTLAKCVKIAGANRDGVAGLIGYCDINADNKGQMDINNGSHILTLRDLFVTTAVGSSNENDAAGLVGTWRVANKKTCTVKNVHFEGQIDIEGSIATTNNSIKSNVGLISGFVCDTDFNNWSSVASSRSYNLILSDIEAAQEADSAITLSKGCQMGGLLGMYKGPGADGEKNLYMRNIRIGSGNGTVSILNGTNTTGNYAVGGLVGIAALYPNIQITDTSVENVTIISRMYASALLARIENQNSSTTLKVDISNTRVENDRVAVIGTPTNVGAGALYGYADKGKLFFTGHNILLKDCQVGYLMSGASAETQGSVTDTVPNPLVIGLSKQSGKYRSYEYLLGQSDYLSYNVGNVGIIGGKLASGNHLTVQLVGVSIRQENNTVPMKLYAMEPVSDSYLIRADYSGALDAAAGGPEPYVTTSPISGIGTIPNADSTGMITVTGDGACGVGEQILSRKIVDAFYDESKARKNLQYNEVEEAMAFYKVPETEAETNYRGFVSDFYSVGDNIWEPGDAKPDNFPVLLLETADNAEVNRMLFSYISVLSNEMECSITDGAPEPNVHDYYTLSATTYSWNGSEFVRNSKNSLRIKDGVFALTGGCYDNQRKQFTLVDVAYLNPADTTEVVYHLYIPVLVKKVLEYKFFAAAQVGTTYSNAAYDGLQDLVIASHGEKITALLGYTYERTAQEWQLSVNSGDYLLWNFKKQIVLFKNSEKSLPAETRMTLVDCNDKKAYHAKAGDTFADGKSLLDFETVFGWSEENIPLCDLLKLSAEEAADGVYVATQETNSNAVIRVGRDYYRLAEAEDSEETHYTITVGLGSNEKVTEYYFLTIKTPGETQEVLNLDIQCPDRLVNPDRGGLPTQRINYFGSRKYSRKGNENKLVLGNFFDQIVRAEVESRSELMDPSDSVIRVNLSTNISFRTDENGNSYEQLFKDYAKGQRIYQAFDLLLEKQVQGMLNDNTIEPGTVINVRYRKNGSFIGDAQTYVVGETTNAFRLVFPGEEDGNGNLIPGIAVSSLEGGSVTLAADVELSYADDVIMEQFPTRPTEESRDGVMVSGSSSISYTQDGLSHAGIYAKADTTNNHLRFYRKDFLTASLYYCAYENRLGGPAEGISRLGINGLEEETSFAIMTAGTYQVSSLPNLDEAVTLRVGIELWQKQEDGSYLKVDKATYLPKADIGARLTGSDGTTWETAKRSVVNPDADTVSFDISAGFDSQVPIQIPVDLEVLTGEPFENLGLQYANYKVVLSAELLKENGEVLPGSSVNDYIIYTNARIVRELVL